MNDFLKAILDGIYGFVGNYGLSIIFFTLLVKMCLLPLDFKSRKGMRKMSELAPKQAELQKKYGHDQDKLNRKMQELYKKEGASPLAGCWPLLLSMPILFAMYGALRYMANEQLVKQTFDLLLTGDTVLEPFLWVKNLWMPDSPFNAAWPNLTGLQMVEEKQWLTIFNALTPDQMAALGTAIGIPDLTTAAFAKGDALNATVQAIGNALSAMPEYIEQTSVIPYLSIDLLITKFSVVANYNGYFVLPILSAASQFLMSKLQEMKNPQPTPQKTADGQPQQGSGAFMKWFFPLFSLWICASSNAAFALYWVVTNLFSLATNQIINWKLDRDEKIAKENPDAAKTSKAGSLK